MPLMSAQKRAALLYQKRADANPGHRTFQIISCTEILSAHRAVSAAFLTVPVGVLHLKLGSRYRLRGPPGSAPKVKTKNEPTFPVNRKKQRNLLA